PPDPQLSMLAVQARDGRPIALLANYSMHYYGAGAVSADYYGEFCRAFTRLVGAEKAAPPFVAMMSHGTSGDLHWMDYSKPKNSPGLPRYAASLAELAHQACQKIEYHDRAPIRMAETKLTLGRRVPDDKRLAWAKAILAKMGSRVPKSMQEVYAREAVYLHEEPTRELILQALRIGDFGITAIPNEVYGLTGLKLKALSPLQPTMNIELANGCEGYIPPPALHPLGGYNTWPARTAGLEVQAEPKIVEAVLGLLEKVAERPRRKPITPQGAYAKAVLGSKPLAYWRMGEFDGPRATDASRHSQHGAYEEGVVFYLEGPESSQFCGEGRTHRAAHFAGGRMKASLKGLATTYSVELWFWNGMPTGARPVTGYLFSWGPDGDKTCPGDHLGIGGTHSAQGKLLFFNGNRHNEALGGSTAIALRTWNHVVLVREGKRVAVYLNGNPTPEIVSEAAVSLPPDAREVFLGGRCDNLCNFEGKIDEVAVYPRALTPEEVAKHFAAAGTQQAEAQS
ncbi:LamG domain-containing protein, partial [bacterium]|nr:LamG domain-containing protein [bacterium]